jgi:hypothetical protein
MQALHKKVTIKLIFSSLLLLASAPIYADFYKYIGPHGEVVLTDQPMEAPYKLSWRKDSHFITLARTAVEPVIINRGITVTTTPKVVKKGKFQPQVDFESMYANRARFSDMINEIANKARLYPELLHAVVKAESAYDPNAVSSAGAVGLMQLMPQTAKRFGVKDRRNPQENLEGGARYLRKLLTKYNNNIKLALAAYNAGDKAVEKYGNKIPPYPETQDYVKKVITFYIQNRRQLAQLD